MITREKIDSFLENKKLAVAGVSRNPRKFSHIVYQDLKKKGYDVVAVNHLAENIAGDRSYKKVSDLPADVKSILILTPKNKTDAVLQEAINKGIAHIWVQQMSETDDTIRIAEEFNTKLIYKKCIYMFAEPVAGVHKFHRTLVKLFGRLPR